MAQIINSQNYIEFIYEDSIEPPANIFKKRVITKNIPQISYIALSIDENYVEIYINGEEPYQIHYEEITTPVVSSNSELYETLKGFI